MAIALVPGANAAAQSSNGTAIATTSAIDTTGATLLVVSLTTDIQAGIADFSDSKSNTWTALTDRTGTNTLNRIAYCANPTVGSGHTFSYGNGFDTHYWGIAAAGFSGVTTSTPFDQESGTTATGTTSITAPSFTPTNDNELVVSGLSTWVAATSISGGGGFTVTDVLPAVAGKEAVGLEYLIQTTKASAAASWSWTSSDNSAVSQAAFIAAAAGTVYQLMGRACL